MKMIDSFHSRLIAAGAMMLACCGHVPHGIAQEPRSVEAMSFEGQPIYRTQLPADLTADALEQIAGLEAQVSRSEMDYIRLGELNAGIGRFQDAIAGFSRGLEAYPDSYRLRRHRGHRLINVRELDRAIIDLAEALELMPETPTPELRPGGDAYGAYQHWIWYHVGLFHYLSGDYARAADAYENAVLTAEGGLVVGSTDWLWNAAMRAGDDARAAAALSRLPDEIPDSANRAYAQRVQLYQGLVEPADILDVDKPEWTGGDITVAYGVANWHAFRGETEAADRIYRRIVDTPFWSAWAFVAAERELTR
jgi:tetratricopeptide (TPR) repeat protein